MAFEEMYRYSAENLFTGMIDMNGDIYNAGTSRQRMKIGIDTKREEDLLSQMTEMQERLDQYYAKLVELGVIVPQKTPEEIAQEQATQQAMINQKLLEAISGLQAELGELKNERSGYSDEFRDEPVGQNSTGNRQKSAGSKGRNKSSPENDSGDTQ